MKTMLTIALCTVLATAKIAGEQTNQTVQPHQSVPCVMFFCFCVAMGAAVAVYCYSQPMIKGSGQCVQVVLYGSRDNSSWFPLTTNRVLLTGRTNDMAIFRKYIEDMDEPGMYYRAAIINPPHITY